MKFMTPYQHVEELVRELTVLQEAYDVLEKINLYYFNRHPNEINGKVLDDEFQNRLDKLFPYDDDK